MCWALGRLWLCLSLYLGALYVAVFASRLSSSLWVLYLFLSSPGRIRSGFVQPFGASVSFSVCSCVCRCLPFLFAPCSLSVSVLSVFPFFICFASVCLRILYLFRFRSDQIFLFTLSGFRQSHRGTFIIFLKLDFMRFQALKNVILQTLKKGQ